MDKTKLREALDRAYELEALMEMALSRDPLPERITDLIADRFSELKGLLGHALDMDGLSADETDYAEVTASDNERIYESAIEEEEEDSLADEAGSLEDEPTEAEDNEAEDNTEAVRYKKNDGRKDLRRCFSINDTFRFRRELFANNPQEYTDAIHLVEAMRSYDEAEEYFYEDLGWDRENEDVQQFMEILSEYFRK